MNSERLQAFRQRMQAYKDAKSKDENASYWGTIQSFQNGGPVGRLGASNIVGNIMSGLIEGTKRAARIPAEEIAHQAGEPYRTKQDIIEGAIKSFINPTPQDSVKYTGSFLPNNNGEPLPNTKRDLIRLYLQGDETGFEKWNGDNNGYDYSNYSVKNNYSPKEYKGNFYNNDTIRLPEQSRTWLDSIADNNSTIGFMGTNHPLSSNADDVGGHLGKVTRNGDNYNIHFSDMWDFQPNDYNSLWDVPERASIQSIQPALLDFVGNPFILRQTIPAKINSNINSELNDEYILLDNPNYQDYVGRYQDGGQVGRRTGSYSDQYGNEGWLAEIPEVTITGNKNYYLANRWNQENPQVNSEIPLRQYVDDNGEIQTGFGYNPGAGYLSGVDPLGELVVGGAALNKPLQYAGRKALEGIARTTGNKQLRNYLVGREFRNSNISRPVTQGEYNSLDRHIDTRYGQNFDKNRLGNLLSEDTSESIIYNAADNNSVYKLVKPQNNYSTNFAEGSPELYNSVLNRQLQNNNFDLFLPYKHEGFINQQGTRYPVLSQSRATGTAPTNSNTLVNEMIRRNFQPTGMYDDVFVKGNMHLGDIHSGNYLINERGIPQIFDMNTSIYNTPNTLPLSPGRFIGR